MSRLTGGIFSKPSGQTAGVVFGQARTRQGKVVTARQLVIPSNPNTADQQAQRAIFAYAKDIVRSSTAGWYQNAFNRAISQLPGFQSMMSIMMRTISSAGVVTAPAQTNLGSLDQLAELEVTSSAGAGSVELAWSQSVSLKGATGDKISVLIIPKTAAKRVTQGNAIIALEQVTRTDESSSVVVPALVNGDHLIVAVFVLGVAPNAGVYSPCVWIDVAVTA
jgi:hypothetical protein